MDSDFEASLPCETHDFDTGVTLIYRPGITAKNEKSGELVCPLQCSFSQEKCDGKPNQGDFKMKRNTIISAAFLTITLTSGLAMAEDGSPEATAEETRTEPETTLDACRDGDDNDGDGHIDCADQDCEIFAICLEDSGEEADDDMSIIDDTSASSSQLGVSKKVGPTRRAHEHTGIFFRGTAGVGGGGYHTSGDTDNLNRNGDSTTHLDEFNSTTGLSISLGGSIAENLILHANLTKLGVSDDENDPAHPGMDLYGLGIGITRYWMPVNIYLTGSVGPAISLLQDGDDDYNNVAFGLMGKAAVGKEWWISENWGIGIAVQANYSYTTLNSVHFQEGSCVAVFSATYN
ncbi:MAG: hypothetical protein GY847_11940 [Proteobacteria bacterium]|nr:hypothetical protein [Pseudomonadota bacterium]